MRVFFADMIQAIPHVELLVAEPFVECPFVRYALSMLAWGENVLAGMHVAGNMTLARRPAPEHAQALALARKIAEQPAGPVIVPTVDEILGTNAVSYGEYVAFPATLALLVRVVVLAWCGAQWHGETRLWRTIRASMDQNRAVPRRSRQARCVAIARVMSAPCVPVLHTVAVARPPPARSGSGGARGARSPAAATENVTVPVSDEERAAVLQHVGFLLRHSKIAIDEARKGLVVVAPVEQCLGKRKGDEHEKHVHCADVEWAPGVGAKKRAVCVSDAGHSDGADGAD